MLVVTLRADESVMIGDDIEVKLVRSTGKQCRLGFEAPPEIPVHRRVIYDRIRKEKSMEANAKDDKNKAANETRVAGST